MRSDMFFVTDYVSYRINAAGVHGVCCILQLSQLLLPVEYCWPKV